jgi:hypothetical protein
MEITASSLKFRANGPEGQKAISYQKSITLNSTPKSSFRRFPHAGLPIPNLRFVPGILIGPSIR